MTVKVYGHAVAVKNQAVLARAVKIRTHVDDLVPISAEYYTILKLVPSVGCDGHIHIHIHIRNEFVVFGFERYAAVKEAERGSGAPARAEADRYHPRHIEAFNVKLCLIGQPADNIYYLVREKVNVPVDVALDDRRAAHVKSVAVISAVEAAAFRRVVSGYPAAGKVDGSVIGDAAAPVFGRITVDRSAGHIERAR